MINIKKYKNDKIGLKDECVMNGHVLDQACMDIMITDEDVVGNLGKFMRITNIF